MSNNAYDATPIEDHNDLREIMLTKVLAERGFMRLPPNYCADGCPSFLDALQVSTLAGYEVVKISGCEQSTSHPIVAWLRHASGTVMAHRYDRDGWREDGQAEYTLCLKPQQVALYLVFEPIPSGSQQATIEVDGMLGAKWFTTARVAAFVSRDAAQQMADGLSSPVFELMVPKGLIWTRDGKYSDVRIAFSRR